MSFARFCTVFYGIPGYHPKPFVLMWEVTSISHAQYYYTDGLVCLNERSLCVIYTAPTSMMSFGAKLYANRGCDPLCCQYTAEFSVLKINIKKIKQYKANQASRGGVKFNKASNETKKK